MTNEQLYALEQWIRAIVWEQERNSGDWEHLNLLKCREQIEALFLEPKK